MEDLTSSPLCQKSDIMVHRPSIKYFVDKINKNDYFSFTRQMHGLWDAVIAAWILKPELRNIRLADYDYIQKLALAMSESKKIIEGLYYEPGLYVEIIDILKNLEPTDSSFMFGVSDTYFYPESPPPFSSNSFCLPDKCLFKLLPTKDNLNYYKVRFGDRQKVMKLLIRENYPLFDAMIWKLYAYRNEIWTFFKSIENHPVVLIGPPHYQSFGSMAQLHNYHHIQIHGSNASENRVQTMDQIIRMHQKFEQMAKPPIYFFAAGSISVYWVYHLHKQLENKFLIDVGQAFNFLFDSNTALMHREFGYSDKVGKGRRIYNTKKLYGDRPFQSSLWIEDNQVLFDLKLKFTEFWLEQLIAIISKRLINLYKVKRLYYSMKHNLHNFIRGEPTKK